MYHQIIRQISGGFVMKNKLARPVRRKQIHILFGLNSAILSFHKTIFSFQTVRGEGARQSFEIYILLAKILYFPVPNCWEACNYLGGTLHRTHAGVEKCKKKVKDSKSNSLVEIYTNFKDMRGLFYVTMLSTSRQRFPLVLTGQTGSQK